MDIQIIKNGFRKAGIHPYNKYVIEQKRFDPLSLSRWNARDIVQVHKKCNVTNVEQTVKQLSLKHSNQESSSDTL